MTPEQLKQLKEARQALYNLSCYSEDSAAKKNFLLWITALLKEYEQGIKGSSFSIGYINEKLAKVKGCAEDMLREDALDKEQTKKEAIAAHNKKVNDAFKRAEKGEVIDLTELMISKEKVQEEHDL